MNNPDDLAAFHRREMTNSAGAGIGVLILCVVVWLLVGLAFGAGYFFGNMRCAW
jgi:hypothetical protein